MIKVTTMSKPRTYIRYDFSEIHESQRLVYAILLSGLLFIHCAVNVSKDNSIITENII